MGLFVSQNQLLENLLKIRKNKKIVFTNGCFDILHVGHIKYLQEAKSLGDILVVGLNSDQSVKKLKGDARPVQNENDRGTILSALGCVDYVALFSDDTPINLIKAVKPDILVKGGDWKPEQIVGADVVLSSGGQVQSLKFVQGKSTTSIFEKILKL